MSALPIWIDRSGVETREKCMRKWYYQRAYASTGLERADLQLAAEIGTGFHNGVEALLQGDSVESAVNKAVYSLCSAYADDPLTETRTPLQVYEREEGVAMAEALVWAWQLVRLPRVLAFGEVVAIEQEMVRSFTVASGIPPSLDNDTVKLIARPDIVQRRRTDGALFIRNLKTTSDANKTWRDQWKLDMQTLSEVLAVEAHLGEPVSGVIIEGAIKGRRIDYPVGSGNYYSNSPLTQAWYREGNPPAVAEDWQARYEHTDPDGTVHRLGRGYRKVPVWQRYPGGIAAWIAWLARWDMPLLDDQFVQLDPILRSPYDIERWKRQTLRREVQIHKDAELVERARTIALDPELDPANTHEELLDHLFPMHTAGGNCLRPGKCSFYGLCHETVGDPFEAGYRARRPHHDIPTEE